MEGFFTALILSGAAVVSARNRRDRRRVWQTALLGATAVVGVFSVAALVVGFALYEWLTVSWAVGVCSCCLALCSRLGWATWRARVSTILVLTLPTIGLIMCLEGLAPNATWAISQAIAQVDYRAGAQWVVVGNGLLNLTALAIAAQRVR